MSRGVSIQGSLSRGSLSRRVSVEEGVSVQGGLCPGGLCPGVSVQEGLCPEGSLSGGVCLGGFCQGYLPYGTEWAVHILLECILVFTYL